MVLIAANADSRGGTDQFTFPCLSLAPADTLFRERRREPVEQLHYANAAEAAGQGTGGTAGTFLDVIRDEAMSELFDVKKLIQHGAPTNADQARQIIQVAMENAPGAAEEWRKRLSSALTEILVGRQLHAETYAARAQALAVLAEIESHTGKSPT